MGIFSSVNPIKVRRSVFDLSYSKLFACDMGQLIPVLCDEVVPGDYVKIGNEIVVRFNPLVAPVLHEINVYVHYFFVPYRLLLSGWENFITGGIDGQDVTTLPIFHDGLGTPSIGTLWDYFGFPVGGIYPTDNSEPIMFPWYAYNTIYNKYYKDETLDTDVALTSNIVQKRRWRKDYFSSSLTSQQRGTAPAFPITGTTSAVFPDSSFVVGPVGSSASPLFKSDTEDDNVARQTVANVLNNYKGQLNNNTVSLNGIPTFNIAQLRLGVQTQKWLERQMRGGARYTETLRSHFHVAPRDERLQRPEYLGGTKAPVIISEVLQTGQTGTTPQGNMAGHGLSVSKDMCVRYHVQEYGLVMGIMSVMPKALYYQGIDRQWQRRTKYDFYWPEFAHLSEQAVKTSELYVDGTHDDVIFGYQGRYNEMRCKQSKISGYMTQAPFSSWHFARTFASQPLLNSSFVECSPSKTPFAAPSQPGLIVHIGNNFIAARPMPVEAEPGLMDHDV